MTDAQTTLKQYREKLLGRTITGVDHLTLEVSRSMGRGCASLVLILDNGAMVLINFMEDLECE